MSKIRFLFAAAILLSTTVSAQNVTKTSTQGAAFVGEEKRVQYLDGNPKTSRTCLELGIAVGAYDNNPNEVTTELGCHVPFYQCVSGGQSRLKIYP